MTYTSKSDSLENHLHPRERKALISEGEGSQEVK